MGLIGTLAVVLAFGLLLWRGARAAMNAPDRFGSLLGIGLVTGIDFMHPGIKLPGIGRVPG